MARTYGEILPESYDTIFRPFADTNTAFVDIGSGHGLINIAAVTQYQCCFSLGIEKYRERQETCNRNLANLSEQTLVKLKFLLEDIGDVDLQQELANTQWQRLIIFSNDLAFPTGVVNRMVQQIGKLMSAMGKNPIYFISTLPISGLHGLVTKELKVKMSWTENLCPVHLYMNEAACPI